MNPDPIALVSIISGGMALGSLVFSIFGGFFISQIQNKQGEVEPVAIGVWLTSILILLMSGSVWLGCVMH